MIIEGRVQLPFRYAAGAAAGRFALGLRDERRLLGARCTRCGRVLCPPGPFCGRCGGGAGEPVEVGPGGELVSWTELPGRCVFGLVRLDGADTALVHRLLGAPQDLRAGIRVQARFAGQRSGSVNDIEGFERMEPR